MRSRPVRRWPRWLRQRCNVPPSVVASHFPVVIACPSTFWIGSERAVIQDSGFPLREAPGPMGRQQRRIEPDALVLLDGRTVVTSAIVTAKAPLLVATSTRPCPWCLIPDRMLLVAHGVRVEVGHLRGRWHDVLQQLECA